MTAKLHRLTSLPGVGERTVIQLDTHEHRVTEKALQALAQHPDVYQRAGALVHAVKESRALNNISRPAGAPHIAEIQLARLRELLSEQVEFQQWKDGRHAGRDKSDDDGAKPGKRQDGQYVPAHVPDWVTKQVAAREQWEPIRHLESISETPVLRPDGSVLTERGYDAQTGVLFVPAATFPRLESNPSRDDAVASIEVLLDPLREFPFAKAEHRSAALAGVLTPLARFAFPGPVPLILIDKNVHGAGGSLLAQVVATMATGRPIAIMSQARDDDEERKRMLAIAQAGYRMVLIDNIDRPLGGAALDAALTATEWRDRVLGQTRMASAPLLACWFATGNNVQVQRDTLRRVLPVRLESPVERPEERSNFRYDPLLPHVEREHPRLVAAALTVLRAYVVAGQPDMDLKPWGSFEGWSALVRAALVWAGQCDPALGRVELVASADSEASALRILLEHWELLDPTGAGITAARMLESVADGDARAAPHDRDNAAALREALKDLVPSANGMPVSPRTLGKRLANLKGRVVGGKALDCRPGNYGMLWLVKEVRGA